jgi:hypothetical protein
MRVTWLHDLPYALLFPCEVTAMRKMLGVLTMAFVATSANAAAGWTGSRSLLSIETVPTGVEILLDGFGGACGLIAANGVQNTWLKIEVGQANESQHIAVLLMAFATGKRVSVYCSSTATWPALANIIVKSE